MPPAVVITQTSGAAGAADLEAQNIPETTSGPPTDQYHERKFLKERLAAAYRIFAKYGFDEGVAERLIFQRLPNEWSPLKIDPIDPKTFWVNPLGRHFSLINASDLIQVDSQGKVIGGGPNRRLNESAFAIHFAIHEARPDVMCACHSHSIYGRTFSALGRELDMITQDHCSFYNDHVVYNEYNGVVVEEKEGINIAKTLGNKKAVLLQNHGILTVGKTIEEAVFWFISMEKCCHSQLMADAACAGRGGAPIKIADHDAEEAYKVLGDPKTGWFSGLPLFDLIEKETGGEYKN